MSIQFNYFASDDDLFTIASTILEWCPSPIVFPERGPRPKLIGTRVTDATALVPKNSGKLLLVCSAEKARAVIISDVSENLSCISLNENPAIEYFPSAPIDSDTVKIGRFYASFPEPSFMAEVRNLFKRLKERAIKLDDSGVWIFPAAARTKHVLKMWAGKDWDNPFLYR